MTDNTTDPKNDPFTAVGTQPGRRPYATLDLKATEIKVTSIGDKTKSFTAAMTRDQATPEPAPSRDSVPRPTPAGSYATTDTMRIDTAAAAKPDAKPQTAASAPASRPTAAASAPATKTSSVSTPAPGAPVEKIVVQKRGGFFSHMAAGLIGGVLALAGSDWALPQLGLPGFDMRLGNSSLGVDTTALDQRLKALEKKPAANGDSGKALAALEERLASFEKTAQTIPALSENQSRFVAETKAALAASESNKGTPEQLERLGKVETQLKALNDAGANDPSAGRLAQLAALTGKVADLETSLGTQLTALRKSVADDVDGRILAVTEASEAAKSGTQRIDKDVAGVRSDAIRSAERLQAMKADNDRLAENLKLAQEETAAIKSALDTLKGASAKPADIAAAVSPVSEKLALLDRSVQDVLKAEADRRTNAERVLLSLELQNLKRALERGQKFGAELDEVQKAAGNKIDLTPLAKFKDQGVPGLGDLTRDFRVTANAAIDAETEPAGAGVVERLIAGAKSVVRVRKVDHNPDDKSAEAIVSRMETALKEARLVDVLSEGKALSPKAQDAARPFLDKVAARVSVDTAVASLETQLKSSFGGAPAETPKSAP